jgi:hypothetical protein
MSAEVEAVLREHVGICVDPVDRPLAERVREALRRSVLRGEEETRKESARANIAEAAFAAKAKELDEIARSLANYERRANLPGRGSLECRVENAIEHWQEKAAAHEAAFFVVQEVPLGGNYETREAATKEARRLAEANPGKSFTVLAALTTSRASVNPVRTERASDDIPF